VQHALDQRGDLLGRGGGKGAAPRRMPEQAACAVMQVARLPAPGPWLAFAGRSVDRHRPRAGRRQQHDPSPPDVVLRALAVGDHAFEPLPLARPEPDLNAFPHAPRPAALRDQENLQRRSSQ
jgi:hypothetical protein